jgi:predicted MFS family arabinose efflux permease
MPSGAPAISRTAFTVLLAAAMAVATFAGPAFAVLARFIIDELGLTRAEFGLVVASFSTVGALASPAIGRLTDSMGGRKALAAIFILGGLGMLAIASGPTYLWLIAAAVLAGFGQAFGNPGTNKLISVHVPVGQRGAITGWKQSGVQAGVFLAGMLLPAGALAWGWRPTMAIAGALSLLTVGVVGFVVPHDPPRTAGSRVSRRLIWSAPILWLTLYGFLMGAAGGAVNTYLPLYGEEGLGLSVAVAGSVAGLAGLVAFFSRVIWARHSERGARYIRSLILIAALSVVFTGALLAASEWGTWLLWVGALGLGASSTSWNSVGMLALMVYAGVDQAGGASGVVLLGFLAGLGLGPPAFGWSVDRFDTYGPGLWGVVAVFLTATVLGLSWRRSTKRPNAPAAVA